MNNISFLITCADIPKNKNIRDIEYSLCIARIFSYKKPVYCVISQSQTVNHPFNKFKFNYVLSIPSTQSLNAHTKSQKEFISIKELISKIDVEDNTFIIKLTGRYLLTNDLLYDTVKNAPPDVDAVTIRSPDGKNIYTFGYAFRFKLLKEYFSLSIDYLGNRCIEESMYSFLCSKKSKCIYLEELGIYADINNEGSYNFF